MQKSNHCLFAPCCHLWSWKVLIWMWQNKGPLVLISVWNVQWFLSLLYQWGPLYCAPDLPQSGARWTMMVGLACFRVTCGLWELAWNLVGAKFMALKLFFSSLIDTCERLLIHKSEGSTNHFGSGFAIKCPSSLKWQRWLARACESEKALQEITVGWYLAPRRTGYLKQCFTGRLKHTKPLLSHLNRYLLAFLGIPNLEGKTWRGVSCGGSLKHIWSRVQSLLYRESMFLSHWQFSLFQVVLLSPATWL